MVCYLQPKRSTYHKKVPIMKHLLISLAFLLTACGGGGGGAPTLAPAPSTPAEVTLTASGAIIDGYVSGATVFLDLNYNGELDPNEPSAISGDKGVYAFELAQGLFDCIPYAPLIVDVPVGAIDEDLGEVTEAYRMVRAPTFEQITDDDILNISPLTSLIWTAIEDSLGKGISNQSCSALQNNFELRSSLTDTIETIMRDIVTQYNLTEDQIFSDFIQNIDAEARAIAINIVKGLKKSYTETLELKRQNPSALFVKVNYYIFDAADAGNQFPDSWYRRTVVFHETEDLFILERMNDELNAVEKLIIHETRADVTPEGMDEEFRLRKEYTYESRDDTSNYICGAKEMLSTSEGAKEYELMNVAVYGTATNSTECLLIDFSTDNEFRYLFVKDRSTVELESGQFIYSNTVNGFPILSQWVNLEDNIANLLRGDLIAAMDLLPYRFSEEGSGEADSFFKQYIFRQNNETIMLTKNQNNQYTRKTIHDDGTFTEECGDDGINFGPCV